MESDQIISTAEKAARCINAPWHLRDEVLDEAIAAAVEATQSWNPSKRVPEEAWVYKKARWAALSFLQRERTTFSQLAAITPENEPNYSPDYLDDYLDLLSALRKLDGSTSQILIGYAVGFPMAILSHHFRQTGTALKERLEDARAQLSALAIIST